MKLWAGQTASQLGSMVGGVALPFAAILTLGATPIQLGALAAADILPRLLFGLPAGAWVDRHPRRPILIAADAGRALLLASIPLAAMLGMLRIEQLYAVRFFTALLTVLFDTAYPAYLPSLVAREELLRANSRLAASASAAEFCGFAAAGWLVQWWGAPAAVGIDAASFLVSAAFLAGIRSREPAPHPAAPAPDLAREIVEGAREVARHRLLLPLAGSRALQSLAGGMIGAVILLFTSRDLGFKPGVLGTIFAIGGVTSMAGAALTPWLSRRLGAGRAMVAGLAGSAAGVLFVPLARGNDALAGGLLVANQVLTDPCATSFAVNEATLRQSAAPGAMLGRVTATLAVLGSSGQLAGAAAGGWVGQAFGLRAALVAGSAILLLGAALLAMSPVRTVGYAAGGLPQGSAAGESNRSPVE